MFGTAESWRKQYGNDIDRLPTLQEDMLRLHGGTVHLDAARQAGLGGVLIERTGKSLPALFEAMSGGAHQRISVTRVPEKLTSAGAGQLGLRELGMLQRHLIPAEDGTIGLEEWLTAFGPFAEEALRSILAQRRPSSGQTSPFCAKRSLPKTLRNVNEDDASVPSGAAPVSDTWPGGFREPDMAADETARAAMAADVDWRESAFSEAPFGVAPDKYAGLPPRGVSAWGTMAKSPTYARTTGHDNDPPYATRYGSKEIDGCPSAPAAPAAAAPQVTPAPHVRGPQPPPLLSTPYGTEDNAVRRPSSARCEVSTPYASGGSWARP